MYAYSFYKKVTITRATIQSSLPTRAPTPTIKPTAFPTPTPTPSSTPTPTKILLKKVSAPSTTAPDYILIKVNEYRASLGLSKVVTNKETCEFAITRAREIFDNFNHDGFTTRVNNKTLPYPGYSEVTENIAYNTNYADVVNRWIASPGHAANLRKDTPYVCIGKYGDYYAYEGWRS